MKYFFYTVCLYITINFSAKSQQFKKETPSNYYTIDYVFTGKVNTGLDSVFALRFTLFSKNTGKLNKLLLLDSSGKRTLNLNEIKSTDSVEVQYSKNCVYVILNKFNPNDIPLLQQTTDKTGKNDEFYIKDAEGSFKSAPKYKEDENNYKKHFSL